MFHWAAVSKQAQSCQRAGGEQEKGSYSRKTCREAKYLETSRALLPSKQSSSSTDDNMFQTGKMRYVSVQFSKGKFLIGIREYWMNLEGEMKPGEKVFH